MPSNDTLYLSATEQKNLLASHRIGALELLELHLNRVKQVNPTVNAIVTLDEEGARRQARAADENWRAASPWARSMVCR